MPPGLDQQLIGGGSGLGDLGLGGDAAGKMQQRADFLAGTGAGRATRTARDPGAQPAAGTRELAQAAMGIAAETGLGNNTGLWAIWSARGRYLPAQRHARQ